MKPNPTAYSMSVLLLLSAGCREVPLPAEVTDAGSDDVVRAAKAPPLLGGTMLVTRDGAYAVISDPPRDLIHIVDLNRWTETGTLELEEGALPFRAAEDADGHVHVSLRGTGALLEVDPRTAEITGSVSACPNPRGVAFDSNTGALLVACAGGILTTIPADGAPSREFIAPDLRDVYVSGGRTFVTQFRAAKVIEVGQDTSTLFGAPVSLSVGFGTREPTTAWRTLPGPDGGWIMLHQAASTDPVPGFGEPSEFDSGDGGYAGQDPCSAVVNPTLSAAFDDGIVRSAGIFGGVALAIDAALSPNGMTLAIASPSQQDVGEEFSAISVFTVQLSGLDDGSDGRCWIPEPTNVDDDIAAVAYQPDGALLSQARDEPVLYRTLSGTTERLVLAGEDARDTGFELFHNDAGQGISCASCHPEGGEDGRTWIFRDLGPRRTQALNVGLEGTAPFHWKGDMDDIHMIARQVRQGAMGGVEQSQEREAALRDWLFSLRTPNPLRSEWDESATQGQQLFSELGCGNCHAGPSFTSPTSADLGFGPLQTPALRGVALRSPFMHDGRSATLEDAVVDMVATTAANTTLDSSQIASIVAYLETL